MSDVSLITKLLLMTNLSNSCNFGYVRNLVSILTDYFYSQLYHNPPTEPIRVLFVDVGGTNTTLFSVLFTQVGLRRESEK